MPSLPVWLGASLALAATGAAGVVAGRALLQRIPMQLLHRLSLDGKSKGAAEIEHGFI